MDASGNYSTGVRGFLEWLDEQQPGISAKVKAQLPAAVPKAFSSYHMGAYRTFGMSHSQKLAATARHTFAGYLGDTSLTDVSLSPVDTTEITQAATTVPDVTQAADTGTTSSSIADDISNIVKGISAAYLTKQQADIQNQVVQTQLQRAAAGLPPLPTSLANLGVPQVSVGLSTGTGTALLIGGGVIAAILLFGGLARPRRSR